MGKYSGVPFYLLAFLFIGSWFIDSHRFNLPYNYWKWTAAPIAGERPITYLSVDPAWVEKLKQKNREQLMRWYPKAIPREQGTQPYQQDQYEIMLKKTAELGGSANAQWFWLSPTSNWSVLFEADAIKFLGVLKE